MEESNTANILLGLSVKPESMDPASLAPELIASESEEDLQAKISKGNIIDHLRQRVRVEAAQTQREKHLGHVSPPLAVDSQDIDPEHGSGINHSSFESYSSTFKAGQEIDFHAMEQDAHHPADIVGVDITSKSGMSTEDIK